MDTCTVPSLALEEKTEPEVDSSKEPLIIGLQRVNLYTASLPESMIGAEAGSSDTAARAIMTQSGMKEAVLETHEALQNKSVSAQSLNEIATDEEKAELVTPERCERLKELVIGQHCKDGDLIPFDCSKDMVVEKRAEIDTAVPFKSVKQAVNMFGGVANWKLQRNLMMERRQLAASELQKARKELAELKNQLVVAEDEKLHILRETDKTRTLIEELTLNLERAQAAEEPVAEDPQLTKVRNEEIQEGVADEGGVACKTQLEDAKGRYMSAVANLQVVIQEFEHANSEYMSLINTGDIAIKSEENVQVASQETRKKVEELTQGLLTKKSFLDIAQATHIKAEEQRIAAAMTEDRESKNRQEIRNVNQEKEELYHEVAPVRDLISKLEASSSLLQSLKEELAAVKESEFKLGTELADAQDGLLKAMDELELAKMAKHKAVAAPASIVAELQETKMKLNEVTGNITLATLGVESLRKELEGEYALLEETRQRVGKDFTAVGSLKAELIHARDDLHLIQDEENQASVNAKELSRALQQAAAEAYETKAAAVAAEEGMRKAKQETEEARAAISTAESRLHAAIKLAEAARASEAMALGEIKALTESESTAVSCEPRTSSVVTLRVEEYYDLSRRAHQAEELANKRVASAMAQVDAVNDGQLEVLKRLEEANKEIQVRREALQDASRKAEMANAAKLVAEDELRKWRAEHGQRRKLAGAAAVAKNAGVPHGPTGNGKSLAFSVQNNPNDSKIGSPEKPLASLGQLLNMTVLSPENHKDEQPSKNQFASKRNKSRLQKFSLFLARKKKLPNPR